MRNCDKLLYNVYLIRYASFVQLTTDIFLQYIEQPLSYVNLYRMCLREIMYNKTFRTKINEFQEINI